MEKQNRSNEPHYYSDRLRQKLEDLRLSAAVVVEAPSGCGKTTAIRDYLETSLPQSTPVYWFTAADEEPPAAFKRLCREIARVDRRTGTRLLKIGLPDSAAIGEACDALSCLQCENETWLVIDNFQFLTDTLPFPFLSSLLTHSGKKLHVVAITQTLRHSILAFMQGHGTVHITQVELRFSADDILRYYAAAGAAISPQEAAYVEHSTGGWTAAVRLHLRTLKDRETLSDTSAILSLLEHLIWDALSEAQRTFLLRLSPFETFTVRQAGILCGCGALPDWAREALQIPFIRFDPMEQRYEQQGVLPALLRQKRLERGIAFDRECLLRAGDLCRQDGLDVHAMGFYAQAGDYGRMLAPDLSAFYFETVGGVPFYELALKISRDCPPELMKKHPLSLLRVAYALLTAGMGAEFCALLNRLLPMLEGESPGERRYLLADWTLLSSYRCFPNTGKMTAVLKRAAGLFGGRHSRVIGPDSPWCYGVYSPLSVFHRSPGEAEREAKALEEYFVLYAGLTNGHGSGADVLFRAELAHYRCELEEAEILAYKAAFLAQSRKQQIIRLAATFHLAEIALKKGDSAGWRSTVDLLTRSASGTLQSSFVLPSTLDTVREILLDDLGVTDGGGAVAWLREGDFSGRQLPDLESHRMMMHLGALQSQKKFARLIGTAEAAYSDGITVGRFADVHLALITAVGYLNLNHREKAVRLVRRAAAMTLPDGILLQLIYYNQPLGGLVRECIAQDHPALLGRFDAEAARYRKPFASVYSEYSPKEPPGSLTRREREVAALAMEGLNNNEIAQRLFLTKSTVRTHLRAVFRKLDIDRRARLTEKLR